MQQVIKYIALLLVFVFVGCNKTNWTEHYREKEKSPFGTYIIHNEIASIFNQSETIYLRKNIYDYLVDINYTDEQDYANYVCIKDNAFKINQNGIEYLLEFVASGNEAFLALNYFSNTLKENLDVSVVNLDSKAEYNSDKLRKLNGTFTLKNKDFEKTTFTFDINIRRNYFAGFNPHKTVVLGTQKVDSLQQPNFIKIYHGKGAIYLHTQPIAFTNYYLLKDKQRAYATNVLSYLKEQPKIFWDPQMRNSTYTNNEEEKKSILQFFWKHPSLKWALYVAFFGLLLFMFFNARRKQRPIPIIKKLKNSTVEFTHTISNLYLKEDNPKNLVDKKITFFLQKVRANYLIDTNKLNTEFIEKLALKSGNEFQTTKYLINTIVSLNNKSMCTQNELERLNTLIENFFDKNSK